jgi:STE24 endopeptidase
VTAARGRRVTGTTLLLLVPLVPLALFGVARAAAPVSLLGVLLNDPWDYLIVAVVVVVVGALLMMLRPVESFAARVLFGMRPPTEEEAERVESALGRACAAAGIARERLLLRIEDSSSLNAFATAGHLVCVTTASLRLPARELEAILAHELGHHAELHPWISALTWWLQLPAVPLKALLRFVQRLIAGVTTRLGGLMRPIGLLLLVLLWIVAIEILWLVWIADALTAAVARRTEFAADARAVQFGYGEDLLGVYEMLGPGDPPANVWARLTAFHPPMDERVKRIRAELGAARTPARAR